MNIGAPGHPHHSLTGHQGGVGDQGGRGRRRLRLEGNQSPGGMAGPRAGLQQALGKGLRSQSRQRINSSSGVQS